MQDKNFLSFIGIQSPFMVYAAVHTHQDAVYIYLRFYYNRISAVWEYPPEKRIGIFLYPLQLGVHSTFAKLPPVRYAVSYRREFFAADRPGTGEAAVFVISPQIRFPKAKP